MYNFLTPALSIYSVDDSHVMDFQKMAWKYPYLSVLLYKEDELDLFSWRMAMDIYFELTNQANKFLYLVERGIVSPLIFFLQKQLQKQDAFKMIKTNLALTSKEHFIYSIYLSNTITIWVNTFLKNQQKNQLNFYVTGELSVLTNNFRLDLEALPSDLILLQSKAVQTIKNQLLKEDHLSPKINTAIFEANKLCYVLK